MFTIKRKINKKGNDSLVSFIFELITLFIIFCVGLFIAPIFFGGGSNRLRHDDNFIDFVLNLYNEPEKYYIIISTISLAFCSIYMIKQLRYSKIIEIIIDNDSIEFNITNRLGKKYIRKSFATKEIKSEINITQYDEYKGINFYNNENKVGYFEFKRFTSLSQTEKDLIELLKRIKIN